MNYEKIGKFITQERKAKNLTQAKLAEKLFISEKTLSKWENGKGLPDTTTLPLLSEIFGISINEILSGERTNTKNQEQSEQLLLNMAKELEIKNKIIWKSMWVIMLVSMIALFGGIFISALVLPEGIWQLIMILGLCVVFLIPCFYALKLEVSVGAYKCKNCGHEIIPSYSEALYSMHFGTTRHLKCPKCHKRTWAKKIIK